MLEFGACPQCKMDIHPERAKMIPVVCDHCGYTVSNSQYVQDDIEHKNIKIMGAMSAVLLGAFLQIQIWDSHWLNIIPVSAKETLGMATAEDFDSKAAMCMDLKKYDCVETAYIKNAQGEPLQWKRTGEFQMKRGKFNEAAQSFYKFFQTGQSDLDVSYNYARALSELGQVDEAVKYFDQVLAAKPDSLQVTVVQNYVKLLMKHKRFEQAKVLIGNVRKNGGAAAESFMEPEFKQINELLTASHE